MDFPTTSTKRRFGQRCATSSRRKSSRTSAMEDMERGMYRGAFERSRICAGKLSKRGLDRAALAEGVRRRRPVA